MTARKLFPTKIPEFRRLWNDLRVDRMLQTEAGRQAYWDSLDTWVQHYSMAGLLKSVLSLPGDIIECGVYRGTSLLAMAKAVHAANESAANESAANESAATKTIFGLDSFNGFPTESIDRCDLGPGRYLRSVRRKFRFCADTPARLRRIFELYDVRAELVPGYFSDTLPRFADHQFCFVHLDCDIYASYKECLTALYDRVVPGGLIVFDEWDSDVWPGARKAIDEFLSHRSERVQKCATGPKTCCYIEKQAVPQRMTA